MTALPGRSSPDGGAGIFDGSVAYSFLRTLPSSMDRPSLAAALVGLALLPGRAVAHVDYVVEDPETPTEVVAFVLDVLANPVNLGLLVGVGGIGLAGLAGYLRYRPRIRDLSVLVDTLRSYEDLVPWMLRLSLGLPLVGAGFAGYLFAPTVEVPVRVLQVGIGFFLLFGLATRGVAALGLLTYAYALSVDPAVILAMEYVPGFLAILLVGGGRPSADHMLRRIAATDGTIYGRINPVHRARGWLDDRIDPYAALVPIVLRVGLGVNFVFLGLTQKIADPARALAVVEKYGLTAVVPVDPGMWVLGAGLAEVAVGTALILGLFTRASAAVAFTLFTLTLFGLPDDPVLAHITLFGLSSAIFTLGGGPFSVDALLARTDVRHARPGAPADD